MASAGTSAEAPLPPVTVTQTSGYDWTLGARKALHTFGWSVLVTVATITGLCLDSEPVRNAILASIPASSGPIIRAAAPVLLAAAWRFTSNWQKHRKDVPAEVTMVPLVKEPDRA
jgi:hypothetical protein